MKTSIAAIACIAQLLALPNLHAKEDKLRAQVANSSSIFVFKKDSPDLYTSIKGARIKIKDLRWAPDSLKEAVIIVYRHPETSSFSDREEIHYGAWYTITSIKGERVVSVDGEVISEKEFLEKINNLLEEDKKSK